MKRTGRRPAGLGTVYKRGSIWWLQCEGRRAESSKSTRKSDATELLAKRLREVGNGNRELDAARTSFDDLVAMLQGHYASNALKSSASMLDRVKQLRRFFGGQPVGRIAFDRLVAYAGARREAGAKAATIRYELALLKQAFRLARRANKAVEVPEFPSLAVNNARQGFFEHDAFERVVLALPPHLRGPARFARLTGWRKSEVFSLEWRQVDLAACVVRLDGDRSKNREGRAFPFGTYPELADLLRGQHERRLALQRERGRIVAYVFHTSAGERIGSFRKAWATACKSASVPGMLFHDLRRTCVRDLERAGVARSRAMKLTGHRTEAVYTRYAIVNEADLAEGVGRLATFRDGLRAQTTVGLHPRRKRAGGRT